MSTQTVRFSTTPDQIPEVTGRIETLLAAIHKAAPQGITYTALLELDGPVFTLVLELADDATNPLPSIPEAAAFRAWLSSFTDEPTTPQVTTLIGNYKA